MSIRPVVLAVIVPIAAATLFPAPALAQDPSVDTYGGPGEIQTEIGAPPDSVSAPPGNEGPVNAEAAPTGSVDDAGPAALAFTGLDIVFLLGGAFILIAVGGLISFFLSRSERLTTPGTSG